MNSASYEILCLILIVFCFFSSQGATTTSSLILRAYALSKYAPQAPSPPPPSTPPPSPPPITNLMRNLPSSYPPIMVSLHIRCTYTELLMQKLVIKCKAYHCPSCKYKMQACIWSRVNSKEVDDKPICFSTCLTGQWCVTYSPRSNQWSNGTRAER